MKVNKFTISKKNIRGLEEVLPQYVFDNCGKRGCLMIGATDDDNNIIGVAQFFISMLKNRECVAEIVYMYVDLKYRGKKVASGMIDMIHGIMRKSGIKRCVVVMDKDNTEQGFFTANGYLIMKTEDDIYQICNHRDDMTTESDSVMCVFKPGCAS